MDHQWQPYGSEASSNRQPRYPPATQQQQLNGSAQQQQQQQQQHTSYGYEPYSSNPGPSQSQSMAVSPIGTPHRRGYSTDGDVMMEDADPYNKMKYPSRTTHQQRPSGQFLSQQDLPGGRRYSPVKALSPSSPYTPTSGHPSQSPYGQYASQNTSARQSPTRASHLSTPSQSAYATPSKRNGQFLIEGGLLTRLT